MHIPALCATSKKSMHEKVGTFRFFLSKHVVKGLEAFEKAMLTRVEMKNDGKIVSTAPRIC